ncbi:aldolase [Skermanella stibiiresistens SB22]|uniref:Aldolase n=1 Tax=Skermanella stibiiresistens SB22 TaxID=1385369 RepID=W9H9G0_9PROT|nr:aldolase [Skermanella stibiiresistens SB22]
MTIPRALRDLEILSARIGRDPELVQGAGGNTSIKDDGVLWVKASGFWLAQAGDADIFIPTDLRGIRRRIAAGDDDPVGPERLAPTDARRPSIETSLHALLPHRVVLHVHSVNAVAWAVRTDAPDRLAERLEGLRWAFAPYARPGLPLTRAVDRAVHEKPGAEPDVIVLGNHGMVIGGDDTDQAENLLAEVERRLAVIPRRMAPVPWAALEAIAAGTPWRPAADEVAHAVGLDPEALEIARGGVLYPDHVVFLGSGVPSAPADADPVAWLADRAAAAPPIVALPALGILLRSDLPPSGQAMAVCLGLVASRMASSAPIRYLRREDEHELLGWDAEKFRQLINR